MTSTVLVPLDGSEKDQTTIPAAEALAELAGDDLHIIRVLDTPVRPQSVRMQPFGIADAARDLRGDLERSVQGAADRVIADTGRTVTTEIADGFDVAGVLLDRVNRGDVNLVVMGTRAPGKVERALRGSVADRVMRDSPRPVVLVPPATADVAGARLELRRVLVPLDGSQLSVSALGYLHTFQRWSELEYVLVEVIEPPLAPFPVAPGLRELSAVPHPVDGYADLQETEDARERAQRRLVKIGERLEAAGAKEVRIRVDVDSDPVGAIARAAREEGADLIAMTTRGQGGMKRLVLGSVAQGIVRQSDVPILLVTPYKRWALPSR
jgi:nucleotide-binding universal stress UspA family protein